MIEKDAVDHVFTFSRFSGLWIYLHTRSVDQNDENEDEQTVSKLSYLSKFTVVVIAKVSFFKHTCF